MIVIFITYSDLELVKILSVKNTKVYLPRFVCYTVSTIRCKHHLAAVHIIIDAVLH